jgi:hypothetical protein
MCFLQPVSLKKFLSDMKKPKLYNQLRHQLKEEKLHIYEPGGEFHKLGNQHLLL